jgi:hypothetical protein
MSDMLFPSEVSLRSGASGFSDIPFPPPGVSAPRQSLQDKNGITASVEIRKFHKKAFAAGYELLVPTTKRKKCLLKKDTK